MYRNRNKFYMLCNAWYYTAYYSEYKSKDFNVIYFVSPFLFAKFIKQLP